MKVVIAGIEYETDNIPELSPEEMAQIMGAVEHIDEGTEKLLRAVEASNGHR